MPSNSSWRDEISIIIGPNVPIFSFWGDALPAHVELYVCVCPQKLAVPPAPTGSAGKRWKGGHDDNVTGLAVSKDEILTYLTFTQKFFKTC